MSKKSTYLNQHIIGAVYESASVLDAYATDRSILKIRPSVVAVPYDASDIRKLVSFANQLAKKNVAFPVTVRGSGLSDNGSSLGSGLVISMEKMNHIQEIDSKQRLVRLQAGVTLGQLNSALALHGLSLPIDGDPRQTIGGMIADHYFSTSSHRHGSIAEYINQVELIISDGKVIQTGPLKKRHLSKKQGLTDLEGSIYREIDAIIAENPTVIEQIADTTQNRAGYSFLPQAKQKKSFDLLPLLYGSEGSLGIITEIIIRCDILREAPQQLAMLFEDFDDALDYIDFVTTQDPSEVMLYDLAIFHQAAESGKTLRMFKHLPDNGTLILTSFDDVKKRKCNRKIKRLLKKLPTKVPVVISNDENKSQFQELAAILSVFLNNSNYGSRMPLIDGVSIPKAMFKNYLIAIASLEDSMGINIPIYGSVLSELYTARPLLHLETVIGRQEILSFLRAYASIVREVGGHLAGSSAEGRLRAIHANQDLSPEVIVIYKAVKQAFDPNNILNPGIKQDATARTVIRQLRTNYNSGLIS